MIVSNTAVPHNPLVDCVGFSPFVILSAGVVRGCRQRRSRKAPSDKTQDAARLSPRLALARAQCASAFPSCALHRYREPPSEQRFTPSKWRVTNERHVDEWIVRALARPVGTWILERNRCDPSFVSMPRMMAYATGTDLTSECPEVNSSVPRLYNLPLYSLKVSSRGGNRFHGASSRAVQHVSSCSEISGKVRTILFAARRRAQAALRRSSPSDNRHS